MNKHSLATGVKASYESMRHSQPDRGDFLPAARRHPVSMGREQFLINHKRLSLAWPRSMRICAARFDNRALMVHDHALILTWDLGLTLR